MLTASIPGRTESLPAVADYLREHRFKELFTDLLGWEHASGGLNLSVGRRQFAFTTIAHKRGLQVLLCTTDSLAVVNRGLLREVQRTVAKSCHEHILIFCCEQPRKQVWQWALRLPDGRKLRHQEHLFRSTSPTTTFLDRLSGLRFTLQEEEDVTLVDALDRVRRLLETPSGVNRFLRRPYYAERSAELLAAMEQGDDRARHEFLLLHLPLARRFSQRLCRWFGMDEDDAEQIGFLGLIEAARRYRPGLGAQFSTYAAYWIIQACQRFGPDFAFLIRLPAHVVWPAFRFQWSLEQMAGQVGSEGVRDHLLELEERDPRTARRHRDCARATTVRSLSDRKEPEYHAARQIREVTATSLDDELKREEQAKLMERALDFLPARDAQVLRLRYGFDGCPPQSLQEIADLMGLSRERIRQLQIRAERRLRRVLQDGLHKAKSSKAQKRQQGAVKAVSPLIPGPGTGAAATTQQLSECRGKAENLVLVPVQEGVS